MMILWKRTIGRASLLALLLMLLAAAPALAGHGGAVVSPAADATVTGTVAVEGTASHPTFRKWQIDLLLDGNPDRPTFLALGEKPIDKAAEFFTWDTTLYPNGDHALRLRVVHSNLNYDEIFVPVSIANSGAPSVSAKPEVAGDQAKPESEREAKAAPEPMPIAFLADAPEDGERWIEISISEQKLTAWQGDVPIFETIVSTGKPGWRTLPGEFAVYRKYDKTRMRGPGYDTPDVPWTMYYDGGFAIHGAYWHDKFGTPVSHGCVNLRVPEAQALYEWASVGTRVVVNR